MSGQIQNNLRTQGQVKTMQADLGGAIVTGFGIALGVGLFILVLYGAEKALGR